MSEQANNETVQPELSAPKRKPRIRLPHKPTLSSALIVLGHALDTEFNALAIQHLAEVDSDELEAIRRRIFDGVDAAIRGAATVYVPRTTIPWPARLAAMLSSFSAWQLQLTSYYHWAPGRPGMAALADKLNELGNDQVADLEPAFALSVRVRFKDGRSILLNRNGVETAS